LEHKDIDSFGNLVGQGDQEKSLSSLLTFFFFEAFGGNPSSFLLFASPIDYLDEYKIIRVPQSD
jgi:hypothetical protein